MRKLTTLNNFIVKYFLNAIVSLHSHTKHRVSSPMLAISGKILRKYRRHFDDNRLYF